MTPIFVAVIIAATGGHIVDMSILGSAPSLAQCTAGIEGVLGRSKLPAGVVITTKCVEVDLPYQPLKTPLNPGLDKPLAPGQGSTDGTAKLPQVTDL